MFYGKWEYRVLCKCGFHQKLQGGSVWEHSEKHDYKPCPGCGRQWVTHYDSILCITPMRRIWPGWKGLLKLQLPRWEIGSWYGWDVFQRFRWIDSPTKEAINHLNRCYLQ